jgi:hypothetical protein
VTGAAGARVFRADAGERPLLAMVHRDAQRSSGRDLDEDGQRRESEEFGADDDGN